MKKVLTVFFALVVMTAAQPRKDSIENGKRLYVRNGCYQCHGYVGQGGQSGSQLAQTKLTLPVFTAIVRTPPPSGMPPYRVKVMSDSELADVFAYIQTFPPSPPASSIPLLNE
jgi:ubiquinol-cytochrome c reductase cytochrome c subunit